MSWQCKKPDGGQCNFDSCRPEPKRWEDFTLTFQQQLAEEKERWLQKQIAFTGLSCEQFAELFAIEESPPRLDVNTVSIDLRMVPRVWNP